MLGGCRALVGAAPPKPSMDRAGPVGLSFRLQTAALAAATSHGTVAEATVQMHAASPPPRSNAAHAAAAESTAANAAVRSSSSRLAAESAMSKEHDSDLKALWR